MGRSPRMHFSGAIYHVMGRGNGGEPIFLSDDDRLLFLGLLHEVRTNTGASLLAWCLMENHYHLLIEVAEVSISTIMRRFLTRYAKRFNNAARRFGHVFQARFKAKLCADDAYMTTVLRYIHNNPVEAGLVADPTDWPWDSHRQFVGVIRSVGLDLDATLEKLGTTRAEALRRYRDLMGLAKDRRIIAFDKSPLRSRHAEAPRARPSLDAIASEVCASTGIDVRGLPGRNRTIVTSRARRMFCYQASLQGYGVVEIARCLALSTSAVNDHLRAISYIGVATLPQVPQH